MQTSLRYGSSHYFWCLVTAFTGAWPTAGVA